MAKTTEEKIAVMQAFVDGKTIQAMDHGYADWDDCPRPVWDWFMTDYRIKPEPEWIPQWGEAVWVRYSENDGWMEGYFNESIDDGFWVMIKGSINCEEFPSWNIKKRAQEPRQ